MTDLELIDCAVEGTGMSRLEETLDDWANKDVVEMYREASPADYFATAVKLRRPSWWTAKEWKVACENYLIDSYQFRRDVMSAFVENQGDKSVRVFDAYHDTYAWMYCQLAPKTMKSNVMRERGW